MLRKILSAVIWQKFVDHIFFFHSFTDIQKNNNLKYQHILRYISKGLQILCIELKGSHLDDPDYYYTISLRTALYMNSASAYVGNGFQLIVLPNSCSNRGFKEVLAGSIVGILSLKAQH